MKVYCIYDSIAQRSIGIFTVSNDLDLERFIRINFSKQSSESVDGLMICFLCNVDSSSFIDTVSVNTYLSKLAPL